MNGILVEINLTDAPVGRIFDSGDPDNTVEQRWFAGWHLPLTPHKYWRRHSPYILDEEGERTILECEHSCEAMMIAGDEDCGDYSIETAVRLIGPNSKAGIVARYLTSRHYYLLTVESSGRIVLYRRDNNEWRVLADSLLTNSLPSRFWARDRWGQ